MDRHFRIGQFYGKNVIDVGGIPPLPHIVLLSFDQCWWSPSRLQHSCREYYGTTIVKIALIFLRILCRVSRRIVPAGDRLSSERSRRSLAMRITATDAQLIGSALRCDDRFTITATSCTVAASHTAIAQEEQWHTKQKRHKIMSHSFYCVYLKS